MTWKSLRFLCAIFFLLLVVVALLRWNETRTPSAQSPALSGVLLQDFTVTSVDSFVIQKEMDTKVFQKKNDRWNVGDLPASTQTVDSFFLALASVKIESLASKNPANFPALGLGNDGVTLTLRRSGIEHTLIFGRPASDLSRLYYTTKGSTEAYLVSGTLFSALQQPLSAWQDLTVVAVPTEKIARISVAGTATFALQKNVDGLWQAESGGKTMPMEDAQMTPMLGSLVSLQGTRFLTDNEQWQFIAAKKKLALDFYSGSGETLASLTMIKKESDTWWVQNVSNSALLVVTDPTFSSIVTYPQTVLKGKK